MNGATLQTKDLRKQFIQGSAVIEVLKGITIQFVQGKRYAIIGTSGIGKSTFMHLLAGLDTPTSGAVFFNNEPLGTMMAEQRYQFLNESIGLVFQLPYLIDELSVVENVALKGLIRGDSYDTAIAAAQELLSTIGLSEKAHSRPSTLSGGQQQRVAILRAIFNKPAFLLADEPTGNLDDKTAKGIIDFLLECQKQWHLGIIVSSHDSYVAEKMEQRYALQNGLLVQI